MDVRTEFEIDVIRHNSQTQNSLQNYTIFDRVIFDRKNYVYIKSSLTLIQFPKEEIKMFSKILFHMITF